VVGEALDEDPHLALLHRCGDVAELRRVVERQALLKQQTTRSGRERDHLVVVATDAAAVLVDLRHSDARVQRDGPLVECA